MEINSASFASLVRVPGIGVKSAMRIVAARKYTKLGFEDLKRMRVTLKRARHFITCGGKFSGSDGNDLNKLLSEPQYGESRQISMFDADYSGNSAALSALTGEL